MYKQKLTLDPKLSEVCEATLTVYDPEPLNEEAATEAVNFTVVGSGVISAEEKAAHQKMRAVAPLAAGEKDVAITSLECVSIDGDVLPAQFQMYYEFHVANYSDEAIASVPVTIYFNTPNSDLVAQGTTTVSNIPAGHYQALQFAFPGVVAGTWMMSMEANQPRAFEESDYTNNLLSKTFTYVNKAELVAEEVSAVTDDPAYDSSGRPIIYYDVPTTLDFCVSNISAISASNVLLQVPAAFQDSTGAYSTMLTEGKIDMPANTRRHAQLNITFTKPATAQIGVVLNSDRACDEVSYDNNEASQVFIINKYNPSTGPDPGTDGEQKLLCPFNGQYVSTGYKDDAPAYEFGYPYGPHYGIDVYAVGDTNIYASGYGEIVGTKVFNSLGNVLAVKYKDVLNHNESNLGPIILRYCHLASIEKDSGFVKPGDKIAVQGASGTGAKDEYGNPVYHLHLEADTDTAYPLSTPSEGGGADTTIDPISILFKTEDQFIAPDCDAGKAAMDEEKRPWYNIEKIRAIPTI